MTNKIEVQSKPSVPSLAVQSLPWEKNFCQLGFKTYCLSAAAVALFGSLILIGFFLLWNNAFSVFPSMAMFPEQPTIATIFGNLVFAPIVETALMIALLEFLVRVRLSKLASVGLSALLWGFLHGTLAPMRFAGSIWSFFVFGYSYFLWSRRDRKSGFWAASLSHIIVNTLPTLVVFLEYYVFQNKL